MAPVREKHPVWTTPSPLDEIQIARNAGRSNGRGLRIRASEIDNNFIERFKVASLLLLLLLRWN